VEYRQKTFCNFRYSHDEYSRQISSDSEKQIQNSPCESPEILYQDPEYFNNQKALHEQKQHNNSSIDRLIVSPSAPADMPTRKNSKKSRRSPHVYTQPQDYSQSPGSYSHSPVGYRQSPQFEQPMHHPTSREVMSVSPLQRDEAQLNESDIHHNGSRQSHSHYPDGGNNDGDLYQQSFSGSPQYHNRNSPYMEGQYQQRESPYARDSPLYGTSPRTTQGHGQYGGYTASPETHRPPPAPRPKSARRPKTAGRRQSARVRQQHQRYEDQETSPPQQCDTTHILNAGKILKFSNCLHFFFSSENQLIDP